MLSLRLSHLAVRRGMRRLQLHTAPCWNRFRPSKTVSRAEGAKRPTSHYRSKSTVRPRWNPCESQKRFCPEPHTEEAQRPGPTNENKDKQACTLKVQKCMSLSLPHVNNSPRLFGFHEIPNLAVKPVFPTQLPLCSVTTQNVIRLGSLIRVHVSEFVVLVDEHVTVIFSSAKPQSVGILSLSGMPRDAMVNLS